MTDFEQDVSSRIVPRDHAYLYLGSISEARRNNELDDWRMSHKQNILCKQAIEDAIRKGFDGMHLDKTAPGVSSRSMASSV